jgi:hypothetical protein
MFLAQLGVLSFERLELRNLSDWSTRRSLLRPSSQAAFLRVLSPLREHERMNLERRRDGLHLNPRLLTQAHRSELKLVAVASNFPWPGSWHNTSALLGESVHESGASSPVGWSVR